MYNCVLACKRHFLYKIRIVSNTDSIVVTDLAFYRGVAPIEYRLNRTTRSKGITDKSMPNKYYIFSDLPKSVLLCTKYMKGS